ncbi:DUF4132 domain-containing protein [Mesobacillus subterraneus]|nr:DUF4132 domain-containing protein [Mesobacillus subterraneus]
MVLYINQHFEKELLEKVKSLDVTLQPLANRLLKIVQSDYYDRDRHYSLFYKLIRDSAENTQQKIKHLIDITQHLLGSSRSDILAYFLTHAPEYPYSEGYDRRPYRSKNWDRHWERFLEKCVSLFDLARVQNPIYSLLSTQVHELDTTVLPDLLAYELDNGNEQAEEFVKNSIYGDNSVAWLNRDILKGIMLSHREDLYKLVGDLLVAARLQEGLRQSIVETMDEGCLAATTYLMKVIIDENLVRYSSIVRAMDVWTGMTLAATSTRVAKQVIEMMHQCLEHESIREEWLESEDANQLYISLWASAVIEEETAQEKIAAIARNGKRYQKEVALFALTQSQNEQVKYEVSSSILGETNHELRALILENYPYECNYTWNFNRKTNQTITKMSIQKIPALADKNERLRQFSLFKQMLDEAPKKATNVPLKVFKDVEVPYSADLIAQKMMYLFAYDMDPQMLSILLEYKDQLGPETKGNLLDCFISENIKEQRDFIFACLSDRSMTNREKALTKIMKMSLAADEIKRVEELLKLKSGSLRQQAIRVLLALDEEKLEASLDSLLTSKSEWQHVGALDIIHELKETQSGKFKKMQNKWQLIKSPTPKEQLLIDKLAVREAHSLKNGFNLYDPKATPSLLATQNEFERIPLSDYFTMSEDRIQEILTRLSETVHEYRDFEYESNWYGTRETLLLGTDLRRDDNYDEERKKGISSLPLPKVWTEQFSSANVTVRELMELVLLLKLDYVYRYYSGKLEYWERNGLKRVNDWRQELLEELYPFEKIEKVSNFIEKLPYGEQVREILYAYMEDADQKDVFDFACKMFYSMIEVIPEDKRKKDRDLYQVLVEPWHEWCKESIHDDAAYAAYFTGLYKLYAYTSFKEFPPSLEELAHAYDLKLLTENDFYLELLGREESPRRVFELTYTKESIERKYPSIVPIKQKTVSRILEIELQRGEMATEVSTLAMEIQHFEGMPYLMTILAALEKEAFVRGYIYHYDHESITKKEALSHLLRVCHPKPGETQEEFVALVKAKKISEKRLLEAAMYAPQWIDLVAGYLKWDGLRSGAWYFHAHVNETMSAEKETIVAHYSPITPEEFRDGAFDIDWFNQAYEALGEEKFRILYECAKYISSGGNHRRSQLFADAVVGKLELDDMKLSAQTKRNKDHLLCYSLIPLEKNNPKAVLERYEFIQQFLKESKQFGAQRRESEAKVVNIALDNLARNAGYKDVTRLRWEMEARQMEELAPFLQPITLDDLTVQLVIDEFGRSNLSVVKNGKHLKSVPAKYKKQETIVQLKEINKTFKEQYSRAKIELERSMEMETPFRLHELMNMMKNPVIAPLVKTLVFKVEEHLGFVVGDLLQTPDGEDYRIQPSDEIIIAHPVHLFESGKWSSYQRHLFDHQIKQPFKQVFREFYQLNADELAAGTVSRRYAGHQVQPRKALALLKNRLWTVNYDEGLQKVFYKENIIASIHAMADWFSPSDIENPTIETVEFFDRHTYKSLELSEIPKVLFSETMRDVDLVVSVAHAGGVDPEASLTTIEMRKAILLESLRLMKIENGRIEGSFAHISGQLGEYNIHLGSGTVFKQAAGAINILPVHSQHRGRIFLPFMDEDPKTAEILSKTILLANDTKIKDPHILEQIK